MTVFQRLGMSLKNSHLALYDLNINIQ